MDVSSFYAQLDGLYREAGSDVGGYLRDRLRLARSQKDELGVAAVANELGSVLRVRGELEESEDLYGEVLAILRRCGAQDEQVATALLNLGDVYVAQGRYLVAVDAFDQAESLLGKGDVYELSAVCNNRSSAYRGLGELARARQDLRRAARLLGGVPDSEGARAVNAINLAQILMDEGRLPEARDVIAPALVAYETLNAGRDIHRPNALATAGKISYLRGAYRASAELYEGAWKSLSQKLGESKMVVALRGEAQRIRRLADEVEGEGRRT
jgi:tetratricopeptide (TPR) repeat protein